MKANCWDFKKCGREPGGDNFSLGTCPAVKERALDGVHDGINAGRACWVVEGTLCNDEVQGTFARKYEHCAKCDFYDLVRREERRDFIDSPVLLARLPVAK